MENIGKQSPRETTTCHTEFVKTPSSSEVQHAQTKIG